MCLRLLKIAFRSDGCSQIKTSSAVLCFVVRCCSGRNEEISVVFTRSVRLLTSVSGAFLGRIMTGCLSFYVYCHFTLVLLKSFVTRLTIPFFLWSGSRLRKRVLILDDLCCKSSLFYNYPFSSNCFRQRNIFYWKNT